MGWIEILRRGVPCSTEVCYPFVRKHGRHRAVKRREFMTLLGGTAVAWPIAARAQQPAMSRIGVVMPFKESDPVGQSLVAAFRQELQKLGWTQGRNIAIDVRYAIDDRNQVRALAVELMGLRPDLMVANSNFVTTILQSEVRTVPLLFIGVGDPIGSGLVRTSRGRPAISPASSLTNLPWGANGWRH